VGEYAAQGKSRDAEAKQQIFPQNPLNMAVDKHKDERRSHEPKS
jgi:hypothetical protein